MVFIKVDNIGTLPGMLALAAQAYSVAGFAASEAYRVACASHGIDANDNARFVGYACEYARDAARSAADVAASVHLYMQAKGPQQVRHCDDAQRAAAQCAEHARHAVAQAARCC